MGTTYVEAIYGANGNYGTSTSNVVAQVVNAASTSTHLTASPNPSVYGTSVSLSATVSSGAGTPSGSVTFYNCGSSSSCATKSAFASGTLTLNGSGVATFSTSSLPVGTTYVEAIYGANGNYGTSTSNVVAQVVNAASTSTHLTASPNPSVYGTSVSLSATVSSGAGTPSGSVTFYNCGSSSSCATKSAFASGTLTLNGSGVATFSTSSLPVGTTYVEAIYGANGNYGTSTSNVVAQVVNAASTSTHLTASPNPSVYGTSVSLSATVSSGAGTPSGSVTFYNCGSSSSCATKSAFASGTLTLNSSGVATFSTSSLPVGTTYVEAIYGANGNYGTSTSNVVAQVVNAASTSTHLTASPNPSVYGTSVSLSATVSSGAGTPSGSVTFYNCGSSSSCATKSAFASGTLTLNGSGVATFSTSSLPVGTTYVEAIYGANGNYGTSTSNVVRQMVNQAATSLVLSASPNPSHFGQAITLSALTTPGTGPTGIVSFYQDAPPNGYLIDTATLNASGQATLVTTALPPGTYAVYAVYSGDANYLTTQSPLVTLTVGYSSPCITGTISGGYAVTSGQSICISGKVSGGVTVKPGGALFLNGATVSGGISSNGATAIRFCGSTISGNVTVSATTGFLMIGDGGDDGTPACADNTITGTVTISNNTGGIELGGDTINGTLNVSGNTGGDDPEIEGNHISGSLSCATSNNPALDDGGQRNTVVGSRTGQCAAGSF